MTGLAGLRVEERGDVALARLYGEVDLSNAERPLARPTAAGLGARRGLVIDLSATEYLGSAWVWLVTRLVRTLRAGGRGIALVAPRARRPAACST